MNNNKEFILNIFDDFVKEAGSYLDILAIILDNSLTYKTKNSFKPKSLSKYRKNEKITPLILNLTDNNSNNYIKGTKINTFRDEDGSGSFGIYFDVSIEGNIYEIAQENDKEFKEFYDSYINFDGYHNYVDISKDVLDYLESNEQEILNNLNEMFTTYQNKKNNGYTQVQTRARSNNSKIYITSNNDTYIKLKSEFNSKSGYSSESIKKVNEENLKHKQLLLDKITSGDTRLLKVVSNINDTSDYFKSKRVNLFTTKIVSFKKLPINQYTLFIDSHNYIVILPHRADLHQFSKDKTQIKATNLYNIINYSYKENEAKLNNEKIKNVLNQAHPIISEFLKATKLK